MKLKKRVAVIGAGFSGLGAMRSLVEEGLEPVCFERTGHHGGLWRYHDEDIEGLASVMKTTVINHSKEMGSFSNKLLGADFPNYMNHYEVYKIMDSCMKEENLVQYIRYNKEVVKAEFAKDYEDTGRYVVTVKDTETGNTERDTFDAVYVGVGHHVYPNWATFPGQEKFKGRIIHTRSLKEGTAYINKNVVVVGTGNSGVDAAAVISDYSKQVYLSTRRGVWLSPRSALKGLPTDLFYLRRWVNILKHILPYDAFCYLLETLLQLRFDHSVFNLKPKHRILSQHPTVSDELPSKILSGAVVVRGNIERFTENGVVFEGESDVTPVDEVVLATGYLTKFPFLGEEIMSIKDNEPHLYKYTYPPHLPHPTLVIIGLIQPYGPGFPIGEALCRLASYVLSGKVKLPSKEKMEADIAARKQYNRKRFIASIRHAIAFDYIDFTEDINDLFGAKPKLWKIFFTDPKLWWALMFGPHLPYQYRLQGPNPWSGARDAILTYKERVLRPLQTSRQEKICKREIRTKELSIRKYLWMAAFFFLPWFWFAFSTEQDGNLK